ncbi:hypothetical protein CDV31_002596 [Fusarium ambrosium]|uniref:Uncharacterized protein n=1 Tax=Fusarium ambrosium TaxID=131363 RepID=A0A428UVY3_9HYPO|nr:hypothetical protein CDV31_002596 [Fusarium ambrosium]
MFVYSGKLNWGTSAKDELFIVILPDGTARRGDSVYLFSQWTKDAAGVKKPNWFDTKVVTNVTKTEDGEDMIEMSHNFYTYVITTKQAYGKLDITMSNPTNSKSYMTLDRLYQSQGELSATDSFRIWTGKLDWPEYASNEPILVLVPEGVGARKPVLAFWQWTEDAEKKPKVTFSINTVQRAENGPGEPLKFDFDGPPYSLYCIRDEGTAKLAVHMKGPEGDKELGDLTQAVSKQSHSHEMTPPEPPMEKSELSVCYPQTEAALPRIQTQMPFPRDLVQTLTHTASFVDQAGYLAKYATERFNVLDKSFHGLREQVDKCNKQIRDLNSKISELTDENKVEKSKSADLEKKLSDARDEYVKKEAELTKQIQDLQKIISNDRDHDAADHKALDDAHRMIAEEQAAKAKLQKRLDETEIALAAAQARVQQLSEQISELNSEVSHLRGQLDVESAHNKELDKSNKELNQKVAKLESCLASTQKQLARTQEDLEQVRAESDDKDKIIEGLEAGMVAIKKDRDAKKKAVEELKKKTDATIQDLETKVQDLEAKLASRLPLPPSKQSIATHESKSTWVRLSPWIGTMANRGHFFNTLDDAPETAKLKTLRIHSDGNWISGFTVDWTDGSSKSYGVLHGSPVHTVSQTPDRPIVAINVVTDNFGPRLPYQTLANMTFFGFDKSNGYQQVDEYIAPHAHDRWTTAVARTSFAPALDGTWALRGVYGYYDGCIDAIGFVWGIEK